MRNLLSALLVLASVLLSLGDALAQQIVNPPTAFLVRDEFTNLEEWWEPASGTWSVSSGTYRSNSSATNSLTTINEYFFGTSPPSSRVSADEYFARARMINRGADATDLVGLVYGYQDSQNYYEVLISATGEVTMRTVMSGVAVDEAPGVDSEIPRNTWLELEVDWNRGSTSLKVNGQELFSDVSQPEFTSGRVGLVTHSTPARFDKMVVGIPFGDQPFLETFDEAPFVTFTPQSGQWSVANGVYRNGAVQQSSVTLAPVHSNDFTPPGDGTVSFTFRARMLNPYANSGNTVGIVFNYRDSGNYSEVVFSPLGVAKVNLVESRRIHTLATASYEGRRNVGFEVALENAPNLVSVLVDGERIFENVAAANPQHRAVGGVGLITHWAPGRFDNVQFDHGVFQYTSAGRVEPCALSFDEPLPSQGVVSGTWDTNGGMLNSTAVHQTDRVAFGGCFGNDVGEDAGTNEIYSARLRNEYGASGNLVGLTYNASGGDYFEVTFSATGVVQLNKFIQGVLYPMATRTHSIPRNAWFDVQVIRSGIFTTIKLNDETLVEDLPQGELRAGGVGAITHWTRGHFDDVSLEPFVSRPVSQM